MKRSVNPGKMIIIASLIMGALSLSLMLINNVREKNNRYIDIDANTMRLVQLSDPLEGDTIAIIDTTLGEIRIVLYPEYSPDAVNNFIELAESGYYDNTCVFDSHAGAYSGMGAKNKDGSVEGGFDQPRERVERELHQNLWPFRGAVCMINTAYERGFKEYILGGGTYYCGSRFIILNSIEFNEEKSQELRDSTEFTQLADAFIEYGGIPNFSQQMTVIGQTYEGFDVVDALASLDSLTNGEYMVPKEDVMINSITIGTYTAGETTGASGEASDK